MARIRHYRDLGVRLLPMDISHHEFWINAEPEIPVYADWDGYEAWQDGRLIGVVGRREFAYPFDPNAHRDAGYDPFVNEPNSWLLLGADLHFRRYATTLRAAVERLVEGPPEPEPEAEAPMEADDALALEGL